MAEFSETMMNWKRMCEYYAKADPDGGCKGCPLMDNRINCGCIFDTPDDFCWEATEDAILDWAEAHPEPMPVTWSKFLTDHGILEEDGPGFRIRVDRLGDVVPSELHRGDDWGCRDCVL